MTVPVKGVDEVGGIDRRKAAKERLWRKGGHEGEHEHDEANDSVLISEEARQRASGRHRKTILEHLADQD